MTFRKSTAFFILAIMPSLWVPPLQAQQVDVPNALVWPQFAIGPLGDDSSFELELVISNTSSTTPYSGELLAADQAFTPINGIEVASSDGALLERGGSATLEIGEKSPMYTKVAAFTLSPLATLKLRIFAGSPIVSVIIGFLILNCLSGSNSQVVASASYRRISHGTVLNAVPILPVLAALGFVTTMCYMNGVNTGLAIVSILALANITVTVYPAELTRSAWQGPEPLQESYSGSLQVIGQTAKFPNEIISNLPEEVQGGLVKIASDFPVWVTALDVVSPPLSSEIEIGAKEVKRVD